MTRALLLSLALALPAAATPSIAPLMLGQAPCQGGHAVCVGDKDHAVVVKGNLSVASPDGGFTVSSAGAVTVPSDLTLKGRLICGATTICGSIALTSASPSTATVTVPSGVTCACWPIGTTAAIAAAGCAANVSSTTLTLTGPNTVTTTMRYLCF